jgi:phosphate transport system substrate-binding protein
MMNRVRPAAAVLGLALVAVGCSTPETVEQRAPIRIDGSSTVFPITQAIAAAYNTENADSVEVDVSFSGTGGGFEKFCAGETDISNASRPIVEDEIAACDAAGIRYYELPVAFDALTVVVNPQNTWAEDITVEELKALWEPAAQGKITQWNQVGPGWPAERSALYGPGLDSGTYDYFAEVVVGSDTRSDFVASEDDEILAEGVANNPNALGYFGLAYYEENQDSLKALAIDGGNGAIAPTTENVEKALYNPLARPLFIYVNFKSAQTNPAVREFVQFYLENAPTLVDDVGYVPLPEEGYHIAWVNFQEGEVGTAFDGIPQPNLTIAELLRKTKRIN